MLAILGLPFGSFETKCQLNVGLVERHVVYYRGKVVSLGHGEFCESEFACGSS